MNYQDADLVIKALNRWNMRAFSRLSVLKFDELNVMRTVSATYKESAALAKRKYKELYLLAYKAAAKHLKQKKLRPPDDIMNDWLLDMLEDYDAVTHYRFNEETERKKARTAEALIATHIDGREADKALRYWVLQLAQYADRSVDDGTLQAYRDAGVKRVRWISEKDNKVCDECEDLDGRIFNIDELPDKPHFRCRCRYEPVI